MDGESENMSTSNSQFDQTAIDYASMTDEQIMDHLRDLSDLPSSLIITNLSHEVFSDLRIKDCFQQMFRIFDQTVTFDYFKNFKRCKANFCSPNAATLAKLTCHETTFHGNRIRCFFATPVSDGTFPEEADAHLKLPPLEKQFLISPPASPPAGWEQSHEKEPKILPCATGSGPDSFELLSRLAALAVDGSSQATKFELLTGDPSLKRPSIVVEKCDDVDQTEEKEEAQFTVDNDECSKGRYVKLPRTPRPEYYGVS